MILERVKRVDHFTEDNDPYGEHDFGSFDQAADKIFWKIDYYDTSLTFGSPDPSDPANINEAAPWTNPPLRH